MNETPVLPRRPTLPSSRRSNRTKLLALIGIVLAGVTLAGYVLFGGGGNQPAATNTAPVVQTARRYLDGVSVPLERANFFPVAVVVENLAASRPAAGLDHAGVVYEALAEGGITRFLAIFGSGDEVAKIGPVRSARTYFLDWTREFDALFVHAGGSPDALAKIPQYQIRDFNQFTNSAYFWRDEDRLRAGVPREHTLFTSSELLTRAIRDTESPLVGDYSAWRFVDDPALDARPIEEKTIDIDFSTFNYKVSYRYDRVTNTYERSMGEAQHALEDGTVLRPKNVIVQYVPTGLADESGRLDMDVIGEGPALVFHNGAIIDATWKKENRESRTRFVDATGAEITFTAGQTWIEVLPNDRDVTYT